MQQITLMFLKTSKHENKTRFFHTESALREGRPDSTGQQGAFPCSSRTAAVWPLDSTRRTHSSLRPRLYAPAPFGGGAL